MFDPTPIFIVLIVIGLPTICITLICLAKIVKGESRTTRVKGKRGRTDTDEAKLIQDIHRGLNRMEERIEALETLMVERESARQKTAR